MARRLAVALIALLIAVPAIALAAGRTTSPTSAQRAGLLKAFGSRSRAQSNCLITLIAASNRRYGTVRPRFQRSCTTYEFNGVNVYWNTSANHWKLVFAGSSYKCPVRGIPRQVQRDLAICK
jgi:hypothetical protein